MGVVGEMRSVYDALPLIRQRGLRSFSMPNAWNAAFDYHTFLVVRAPRAAPPPANPGRRARAPRMLGQPRMPLPQPRRAAPLAAGWRRG